MFKNLLNDQKISSHRKIIILKFFKKIFESFLNFFVYLIFHIHNKKIYGVIISEAFYKPWKEDQKFQLIFKKVYKNTMLDESRLYNLYLGIKNTSKLQGDIIEVGAWKGGSGALMSLSRDIKDVRKMYLYDTFKGVVKSSNLDKYYTDGLHSDCSFSDTNNFIKKNNIKNFKLIAGIFPEIVSKKINKIISFCHLDVDTYQSLKDCYNFIWPRLVKFGIIIFDDYGFHQTNGASKFIRNISVDKRNIFISYTNGQSAIIKR